MKRDLSLLMGILGFVPILAQQSGYYYYYKGERIDLTVDSTRLYVVSEGEYQSQNITRTATTEYNVGKSAKSHVYNNVVPLQKQRTVTPEVYFTTLDIPDGTTATQYDTLMAKVKAGEDVWQVLPSFTANGKPLNISNNFYVKLKSADDSGKLQQMATQYGLEIIGNNEFMPLWYTLSCNAASSKNAVEAANLFQESGAFACSKPEFCYSIELQSDEYDGELYADDEYYSQQWNLKNTGQHGGIAGIDINVEGAWETTKGDGVVVAVYDMGIYKSHPDLESNIHELSYNVITGTSPSTIMDDNDYADLSYQHGTNCAGIIGALQNNDGEGISGIAPEVQLMDVSCNMSPDVVTDQQIANGFGWAWKKGADIISCSWNFEGESDFIDEAIDSVFCFGRNGKGCVVVFSAGNEDTSAVNYPARSDPRIIVVGGITPWGRRAEKYDVDEPNRRPLFGSNYGEHVDVVAPAVHIPTTSISRTSFGGYMPFYDTEFWGTSSACPHVAGVAALLLSIDPDMPVEEVEYIITKTAREVRPNLYSYQKDTLHTNAAWNNEVGYGLVDATAAVEMAKEEGTVTTYIRNRVFGDEEIELYRDKYVEIEHVRVDSGGQLHIDEEKRAILKSSVRIKKGGIFTIYNVSEE